MRGSQGSPGTPPPWLRAILDDVRTQPFGTLAEAQAHIDRRIAEYNATPQAELGGLSPRRMTELLDGDWETTGTLRVNDALTLAELDAAMLLHNARDMLATLRELGPVKATDAGNLNRQFVATMLGVMRWPEPFVREIEAVSKAINERDVLALHVVRVLLELARLITRRKGAFRLAARGKHLLEPDQAGRLYAILLRTTFRELNLDYVSRAWPNPSLQHTVAFTLYRLAQAAITWRDGQALAAEVVLPEVTEAARESYDNDTTAGWQLWGMVLRPLGWFGLLEEREVKAAAPGGYRIEVRKTPLYDQVLSFRFRT